MRTIRESQREKATTLLSLHTSGDLLVLPNVWSPIGARVLQTKGYPAVATASAAISSFLGYEDGEKLKRSTLLDLIGRIAISVDVPVSADIEAGYGRTLSEVVETIDAVIDSGIVGINIEDTDEDGALRPVEDQCRRISAVKKAASRRGLHLVINARIDSYVSPSLPNKGEATEDAVLRAKAYSRAGADCVYPIGPGDRETVRVLRARIDAPINILATPEAAPLSELKAIGVNRVSFGPFIFRSCLNKFIEIAETLTRSGDYSCFSDMLSKTETSEYLMNGAER